MSTTYLTAGTGADGTQLWEITVNNDGSTISSEVADMFPGLSGYSISYQNEPLQFTPFKNGFLFVASGLADESTPGTAGYGAISPEPTGSLTGSEVWYTNGTSSGTHLVYDAYQGLNQNGNPNNGEQGSPQFTVLSSSLALFVTTTGSNTAGLLFATDGTYATPTQLTASGVYGVSYLTKVNSFGVFSASIAAVGGGNLTSNAVFVTDGTVNGTRQVSTETGVTAFTLVNSGGTTEALFTGADQQVWATDGNTATELTSPASFAVSGPISATGGGEAIFFGTSGTNLQLWVTDGTSAHTSLISNDVGSSQDSVTSTGSFSTALGASEAFFETANSGSASLWVTDGTAGNTTNIASWTGTTSAPLVFGHEIAFLTSDTFNDNILEATNGTGVGTFQLASLPSTDGVTLETGPNGSALFVESVPKGTYPFDTVFRTNGTTAGTGAVTASNLGYVGSAVSTGNEAFFLAAYDIPAGNGTYSQGNRYLFSVGESGSAVKLTLNGDTNVQSLTVIGSEALFSAHSSSGIDTWITDGTQAGTHLVAPNTYLGGSGISVALPCFLSGTRLRTPTGERAVETLRAGDVVLTHAGAALPIQWVGRSPFDTARHPRPQQVTPIRIRAGAFADGLPVRDLVVSPGHAILVGGVLIQAERLVNGATITRDESVTAGTYFHVELERHDILLSEGLPSESFLDTGNRAAFVNGGQAIDLHPDLSPRHWTHTCVPLIEHGPLLVAARARLIARAQALGWQAAPETPPVLRIDGRLVPPTAGTGTRFTFAIPAGVCAVQLVSPSGIPAEMSAEGCDSRRLGLLVDGLSVRAAGAARALDLADPTLGRGWHQIERDGGRSWRWTDGEAAIAVRGPCELDLSITGVLRGWTGPAAEGKVLQAA